MSNLSGSCNCGSITYDVTGKVRSVVNCHCGICRKMNGSAFSTYVAVADEDITITGDCLQCHNVTESAKKHFCKKCGTPIFNSNPKYSGLKILHLGSLDSPLDFAPNVNIYCESRLDWLHHLPDITSLEKGL